MCKDITLALGTLVWVSRNGTTEDLSEPISNLVSYTGVELWGSRSGSTSYLRRINIGRDKGMGPSQTHRISIPTSTQRSRSEVIERKCSQDFTAKRELTGYGTILDKSKKIQNKNVGQHGLGWCRVHNGWAGQFGLKVLYQAGQTSRTYFRFHDFSELRPF